MFDFESSDYKKVKYAYIDELKEDIQGRLDTLETEGTGILREIAMYQTFMSVWDIKEKEHNAEYETMDKLMKENIVKYDEFKVKHDKEIKKLTRNLNILEMVQQGVY